MSEFEAVVLAQKPTDTPWTPVTDYSFEARRVAEGGHPDRIWQYLIPCDDADVLDYGCGPASHLVRLLEERRPEYSQVCISGYDPQLPGSERHLTEGPFDLVICREVLEHLTLREIAKTVRQLCALSAIYVYVTTRFSSEHEILRVETHDDLDPTHITLASKDFYRVLFTLEGFRRRADLENLMDWRHLNRVMVYERVV